MNGNGYRYTRLPVLITTVILVTFLMVTQRVLYKKDLLKHRSQYLLVTVEINK